MHLHCKAHSECSAWKFPTSVYETQTLMQDRRGHPPSPGSSKIDTGGFFFTLQACSLQQQEEVECFLKWTAEQRTCILCCLSSAVVLYATKQYSHSGSSHRWCSFLQKVVQQSASFVTISCITMTMHAQEVCEMA